jgi:dCMP deaminase
MKNKNTLSYLMQENQADEWDNMFFSTAVLWSRKSPDKETQCGCVLVKNKTIVSTGYNGFMRDVKDCELPNTRPNKYPFMLHAEENAVYNAAREGKSTIGSRAYITAIPCKKCLQMLWQCGVHEVYFSDLSKPKLEVWGDCYDEVLEQISDRIVFKFIPKSKLSNFILIESAEKFENFGKDV